MPRHKEKLRAVEEHYLVDLLSRGRTIEECTKALHARGVKLSASTIQRRARELRGKANAKRARTPIPDPTKRTVTAPAVAPAAPTAPAVDIRLRMLVEAEESASDADELASASLALLRHHEPEIDEHMKRGSSLINALLGSETHANAMLAIRRAEDFASLAELAAEEERADAIVLLREAIALLEGGAPCTG